MNNIIGTCGNCGGPVEIPSMMVNPVPKCTKCGATPKNLFGPKIDMEPPSKKEKWFKIE